MTDRNWEAELAKIDKQLSSISDDQLVAEQRAATTARPQGMPLAPAARGSAAASPSIGIAPKPVGVWRGWLQAAIALAAAVGLLFWPWPPRCGTPLFGFVAATGAVTLLGIWSAFGTWRHRLGAAHLISLAVVVFGAVIGAREILPRVGYALPTVDRQNTWNCLLPPTPTAPLQAVPTPPPTDATPRT